MKRKIVSTLLGFAMLSAACGPRPVSISSETIETRVAATFTAIGATEAGQPFGPSALATSTRVPAATQAPASPPPTSTGVRLNTPAATPPASPSQLKPADSDAPAAGICAGSTEEVAAINVIAGAMPDVRCMQVKAEQRLRFTNQTGVEVHLKLGRFEVTIAPGQAALLDAPCGSYLAPGSHFVSVSEGAVPEIWLVEE